MLSIALSYLKYCRTHASAFSMRHSQRRTYVRRLKESKAAGSPEFPINLWFVNLLRSVSCLNTVQTGEVVKEDENDFLDGRGFSEEILKNAGRESLLGLVSNTFLPLYYTLF
jgi:hypothetical protein